MRGPILRSVRAIVEANTGDAVAYGADPWTERAVGEIRRLSGAQGEVYLVLNGSGANVLGLGLLLGRHEAVICAESAHINTDECGSAERILGTKLLTVPAPGREAHARTDRQPAGRPGRRALRSARRRRRHAVHGVRTCYSLDELRAIKDFCAANGLRVFLDGARARERRRVPGLHARRPGG